MMKTKSIAPSQTVAARSTQRRPGKLRMLISYAFLAALVVAIVAGMWPKPVRVDTAAITHGPLTLSVFEEGKWMTFAVKEGKAHLRKVEIAHNNGITAEVRSGWCKAMPL